MILENNTQTKAGFVAIVGMPNAGKSTLLNTLLGHKVAIVTPKAQTTRLPVRGILTQDDTQLIFVDTPGLYHGKRSLEDAMYNMAMQSWQDADAVLMVLDVTKGWREMDEQLLEALRHAKGRKPLFLAMNKVDLLKDKAGLLPLMERARAEDIFTEVFPISALKQKYTEDLLQALQATALPSPFLYDSTTVTDTPLKLRAAEVTREKAMLYLQDELPYGVAVEPLNMEVGEDGSIAFYQNILIDRQHHKEMVLGKHGAMLKKIGTAARKELTYLLGVPVHVFNHVKVKENWANSASVLQTLHLR